MLRYLQMPGSYYSRQLGHGWRLIVLDTTELSGHHRYPKVHIAFEMLVHKRLATAHLPAESDFTICCTLPSCVCMGYYQHSAL